MCLPKKDSFLGGGIPAGSVVLLINESDEEEDGAVDYTRLLIFFLNYLASNKMPLNISQATLQILLG